MLLVIEVLEMTAASHYWMGGPDGKLMARNWVLAALGLVSGSSGTHCWSRWEGSRGVFEEASPVQTDRPGLTAGPAPYCALGKMFQPL